MNFTLPKARLICESDNVFAALLKWQRLNLKTAIVTLVGIDGSSPRPLGAQMAVAEDGSHVGYLSGGCFENAVAAQAVAQIKDQRNALIRYGKGSAYFDIQLPCGSGLDLYFDHCISTSFLQQIERLINDRTPASVAMDLGTGFKTIVPLPPGTQQKCGSEGNLFRLTYLPVIRTLVAGNGAIFSTVAKLFKACGFMVTCITHDEAAGADLARHGIEWHRSVRVGLESVGSLDCYSAVVLTFHEHEHELPVLEFALRSDSFYIGALGGHLTSSRRRALLEQRGFGAEGINRIRSPIGLIPNAKSKLSASASILAELVLEAKVLHIIE
jgi:xanthine dehydrogenase accessory factor